MTYRMLLDRIVGYKFDKNPVKDRAFAELPVLLPKSFSEVAEEFCPQEVEDELLYLRMKEAYEHVGEYLEQLTGEKLNVHSQKALLEHLLERDSLATAMGLIKSNSQDSGRDGWDRMTLDKYFESRKEDG
jgi:hypothetical protein